DDAADLSSFAAAPTHVVTAYDGVVVDHYVHSAPVSRYDPAASSDFTLPLACGKVTQHRPCADTDVDVVLWDDLLRAEGPGWQEVRMPHGARLRIARVPRSASLRVSEGLGVEIVR